MIRFSTIKKVATSVGSTLKRICLGLIPNRLFAIMFHVPTTAVTASGIKYVINNELSWRRFEKLAVGEPMVDVFFDALSPGKIFWDIGACIGSFSAVAAKKGLQCVAFEANPVNLLALKQNIDLNSSTAWKHEIVAAAIGSGNYLAFDAAEMVGTAQNFSDNLSSSTKFRVAMIDAEALRECSFPLPNYIKIDVDGAEKDVVSILINANVLRHCDLIYIEIEQDKKKALTKLISDQGFSLIQENGENFLFQKSS